MNFAKFLGTPFLQDTSGQLLLFCGTWIKCSNDIKEINSFQANVLTFSGNIHYVKSVQILENTDRKKLRVWTLFTQWLQWNIELKWANGKCHQSNWSASSRKKLLVYSFIYLFISNNLKLATKAKHVYATKAVAKYTSKIAIVLKIVTMVNNAKRKIIQKTSKLKIIIAIWTSSRRS